MAFFCDFGFLVLCVQLKFRSNARIAAHSVKFYYVYSMPTDKSVVKQKNLWLQRK